MSGTPQAKPMTVRSHIKKDTPPSPEILVSPPCSSGSRWICGSGICTSSCSIGIAVYMAALSRP